MGNPFQDQLIKAGLVSKKQAGKANQEKYLRRKKNKGASKAESADLKNKARAEQAALARRNQELNLQRAEAQRQREHTSLIKQLVKKHRLKRDDHGEPYYFTEQDTINRIFVSEEMAEQLSSGRLAIVTLNDSYEVVPAKVARQIADHDKNALVALHEGET